MSHPIATCGFIGLSLLAVSFSTAQSGGAQPLPTVERSASSEDGRELFNLHVYEPWEGAGRRVITLTAASISTDGLVGLHTRRFCDVGSTAEPVVVKGHHFQCSLSLAVPDWTNVDETKDVTMTVTAME